MREAIRRAILERADKIGTFREGLAHVRGATIEILESSHPAGNIPRRTRVIDVRAPVDTVRREFVRYALAGFPVWVTVTTDEGDEFTVAEWAC